jgi:hypothetical protein
MEEEGLPKVPIQGVAEAAETHIMPRLHPDLFLDFQFSILLFRFPVLRTSIKGTGLQDAEDIKKNVKTDLYAVPFEVLADCSQKL